VRRWPRTPSAGQTEGRESGGVLTGVIVMVSVGAGLEAASIVS
jgi:hypothetical protein